MSGGISGDTDPSDLDRYGLSEHALGIDLDCQLDRAADFLHALTACWQGSIIGFMVDKSAGVEEMQRLGIDCHQLFGVTSSAAKAQAVCDTGVVAIISDDEHVLRRISNDVVRLLVL